VFPVSGYGGSLGAAAPQRGNDPADPHCNGLTGRPRRPPGASRRAGPGPSAPRIRRCGVGRRQRLDRHRISDTGSRIPL